MTRIVLASTSPRRRELLARAGVRFTVADPPDDVPVPPGMCSDLAAQLVARHKAIAVAATLAPGSFVLGADTMVIGPKGPLGKPHTPERAREMLCSLRGLRHTVLTGICAIAAPGGPEVLGVSRAAVRMRDFSDAELDAYIASGEPLDKAGAYAVQGAGGDLIEAIGGRLDTVVGLDVALALRLLTDVGYPLPLPSAADLPPAPQRSHRPLSPMRTAGRV